MKSPLALLVLFALASCACPTIGTATREQAFAPMQARVLRVIDGDTFTIMYDGEETSVRLFGVNAPELRDTGGAESKARLAALIVNQDVMLAFTAKRKRDSFGRLLATVTINGVDVGNGLPAYRDKP